MPLMPKRVKFRKSHLPPFTKSSGRGNEVAFGDFGLKALGPGFVTARQIEAGRVAASHFMGGEGRLWIRIFPHFPVTAKPLEQGMGAGKGETSFWVAKVEPGRVLYEVGGVAEEVARQILARASRKLPVRCRFVPRRRKL